uniref:Mitochondrial ribosomal protein L55 n=1 Tax=Aotus nancymaae TaxID=37293 RepID=A0A2K5EYP3_AOTNA
MAAVGSLLGLAASSCGSDHSLRLLRKCRLTSACMFICSLLRCSAMKAAGPTLRCLHASSRRADSSRASLARVRRQAYARLYPVLLVKQDGSTVHIRYREPRRMLAMPVDLDTLTPEERRARLRKREAQLQRTKEYEQELSDDFDVERYRQFWAKTRK